MPPFIPRKRPSVSPPVSSRPPPSKRAKLADVLDAESTNIPGLQRNETFSVGASDDSDSSLSDVASDLFENVPQETKPPVSPRPEHDDEDENVDWEDAAGHHHAENLPEYKPQSDGPIEITLRQRHDEDEDDWLEQAAAKIKKAASKRDKQVRLCSHQLHVQFLLWHNAIRNSWISDREVQQILVRQLPIPIKKEVDKWKRVSGLNLPEDAADQTNVRRSKSKGKQKAADPRRERDWGRPSARLEQGKPDMSSGDPLIPLVKVLAAYWKKRFHVTAPGLRKRGYGTARELRKVIQSLKNDEYNQEQHGERIRGVKEFRELARKCEGSRDVGAQLFTALLRGLGIESRLVASLQPSGYGWTKAEQLLPPNPAQLNRLNASSDDSGTEDAKSISMITKATDTQEAKGGSSSVGVDSLIVSDDDSIVDVTPAKAKRRPQIYDRDHPFPIYWTEAISPITNKVLPVSLVLATPVAVTPETLGPFEPRGTKAEKTKTVMAYVVAYSSDGTAKDVTVRYLRKHIWPGKTKGFRYPVEKIPIYNKHGKVKRYEDFDWFKRLMSFYARPDLLRTTADDVEDATDLVRQEAEQKTTNQDVDTLQSLKASAEFVLERFLRREEALRPTATPVRMFTSGKGESLKQEPVYLRRDVERCLTAESWHKEGRRPKAGETPLKLVPVRAVTITRKREAEEHERITGEKQMQGLYSWDQTEYIIPPPIVDGIIPKNAYGNIDCFVPSMVPEGAVHIPLRGTVRICKRLEIDFAEAVTGFEFGNKRAVPICTGVVVAEEHAQAVRDAWHEFHEAQRVKEEKKLEAMVLEMWRKFVVGLRIRERVRDTYGEGAIDELIVGRSADQLILLESDHDGFPVAQSSGDVVDEEFAKGGGFLPDSDEEHEVSDLEIGYHPNDDRKAEQADLALTVASSNNKSVRAAEAQYPTPSSISPPKPPLHNRLPKMSFPRTEQAGDGSELSSVTSSRASAGESESNGTGHGGPRLINEESEEDEVNGRSPGDSDLESDEYRPARHTIKSNSRSRTGLSTSAAQSVLTPSEKAAPTSTGRSDTRRVTRSKRTTTKPKPITAASTTSSADEDEEAPATHHAKTKAKLKTKATARGRPKSKRGAGKLATPKAPTGSKRRRLRRDSTVVTSPYFDD